MLKVYYWNVCPHCHKAMEFLKSRNIPFEALDIEKQPEDVSKKSRGCKRRRRLGRADYGVQRQMASRAGFDAGKLEADLKAWGVI